MKHTFVIIFCLTFLNACGNSYQSKIERISATSSEEQFVAFYINNCVLQAADPKKIKVELDKLVLMGLATYPSVEEYETMAQDMSDPVILSGLISNPIDGSQYALNVTNRGRCWLQAGDSLDSEKISKAFKNNVNKLADSLGTKPELLNVSANTNETPATEEKYFIKIPNTVVGSVLMYVTSTTGLARNVLGYQRFYKM